MKNLLLVITLLLIVLPNYLFAQGGVGINNDNSIPDNSAMLDVKSTNKGLLAPRMTMMQRDAIVAPATGLLIYQTNATAGFYVYDGAAWVAVTPAAAAGGTDWTVNGNDVYNVNTGNVGIGTTTPSGAKLNVEGTGAVASSRTIEYRAYVYDNAGNFTGSPDGSVGSTNFSIPSDIANSATAVNLTINLGGNVEGNFGFGVRGYAYIEGTNIAMDINAATGVDGCGDPNNGGVYYPTVATAIDVTALVTGLSTLTLTAEDAGGAGAGSNFCGFAGLWFEYVLTYTVPIIEPAIAVESGTLQLSDLAGNGNAGLYIDNQGDLQMAKGTGPLMVRNPDGTIGMQNYIHQSITIGNQPWEVTNSTIFPAGTNPAVLEVRGGTQRILYGSNIREYDSIGTITNSNAAVAARAIHSNGHTDPTDYFGIHADFNIAGGNFFAHSDVRIKNVLGYSIKEEDLDLLNSIQITDYKYKDTLTKGNKVVKKVIAQELREVYPEAVTLTSRMIPSIYQHSNISDGWIPIANADLKVGDLIEYYVTKDGIETRYSTMVVAIEEDRFRVGGQDVNEKDAFIYGKMVNDFHVVDYDALTTLNISATQALLQRIEALEKENEVLKLENQGFQNLKAEVEAIKSTLNMTGSTK